MLIKYWFIVWLWQRDVFWNNEIWISWVYGAQCCTTLRTDRIVPSVPQTSSEDAKITSWTLPFFYLTIMMVLSFVILLSCYVNFLFYAIFFRLVKCFVHIHLTLLFGKERVPEILDGLVNKLSVYMREAEFTKQNWPKSLSFEQIFMIFKNK